MLADILSAYGCVLYNMVVCSKQNKTKKTPEWLGPVVHTLL